MDRKEKIKRLSVVVNNDRDVRGGFLIQTSTADHIIADILTAHFTNSIEKHNQLYSYVIMPELNFKKKIEILKKVLKKYYDDLFNEDLFKSLKKIREFRNRIAHAMIDNSIKFLEGDYQNRLSFVYYQDGIKKRQIITKKEFQDRTDNCSNVLNELQTIQSKILKIQSSGTV